MSSIREILYQALAAEVGVVVETPNPEAFRQACYVEMRRAKDPALKILMMSLSPNADGELWIYKDPKGNAQEK